MITALLVKVELQGKAHLQLCNVGALLQLSKPPLHCKFYCFVALGMHRHHACLGGFLLLWGMAAIALIRKEEAGIDLQRRLLLRAHLLPCIL